MANKQIQHVDIASAHCHEPKGVSTASANSVYVADGAGSGNWEVLPQLLKSSAYPVGFIKPFAGEIPPLGWSLCDGSLISRITYGRLFSVVGVSFGIGDGATTFALPDCRGRLLIGKDNMGGPAAERVTTSGSGINGEQIGSAGGLERITLVHDNFPSFALVTNTTGAHTHTAGPSTLRPFTTGIGFGNTNTGGSAGSGQAMTALSAGAHSHTYSINTGSPNTPHNNVQPTIIMNMIIYHGVA